ncbi:MAG: hypothetical protein HOP21_11170 [Methylotenera sp.]|nr:hypothetical protein [Methylotenera sp.]
MSKEEEKNKPTCFVVMPISDVHGYDSGHFGRVYEHLLRPAIIDAGYTPIRADDTTKTDYIVVGIIQQIVQAEMVVCDFSAKNPNVMYELGIRHAFGKPVTLIKDRKTDKVFDIQGLRYTEYDESLRIDSVQKDVSKISSSIKETAASKVGSINSVVQLAGIKAAEVPAGQTVSADTQLLLSAIATLERRIESQESPQKQQRFFSTANDKTIFSDGTEASLGADVFDGNANLIGTLIDIHPADEKIFIQQPNGKVIPYSAYSIKARGLSTIPF